MYVQFTSCVYGDNHKLKWLENNHVKGNTRMSHILISNKKTQKVKINDVVLTSSV